MTSDIATRDFMDRLRDACNQSEPFGVATAFADTKLVFAFGARRFFWKIYKGKIIDSQPFVTSFDPLGYDVIVQASPDVWRSIAERSSRVWDHFNSFEFEIGGNHLEAHRMHEALLIVCQDILPELIEKGDIT